MNQEIEDYFIKALKEPKVFDKEDIKRVGEEIGLEFEKRAGKDKVITQIIESNGFDKLYDAFNEFVYIPVWEVADFYNLNTEQIDKLQEIKVIKEVPLLKEFYSRRNKEYYTSNTYNIGVLQNYTTEELKKAYTEAYEQDGYRTRVEATTEEEIQELINELKKSYKIDKIEIYSKRNEGFHAYFTIKKLNNSKNEENAMLVEIQKLKNEIEKLNNEISQSKKEKSEAVRKAERNIFDIFEVDNMIQLRRKSYDIEKLKKEVEQLSNSKQNERGAGRKSRFSDEEKENIKLCKNDKTIKEIAEMYNCSVGLIHKIINEK